MLVRFIIYSIIALVTLLLVIILGDYGPWYFAWIVGTVMIVLISAAGGAMLDTQIEHENKPQ
jgi:predicted outer membrane lipoprotein